MVAAGNVAAACSSCAADANDSHLDVRYDFAVDEALQAGQKQRVFVAKFVAAGRSAVLTKQPVSVANIEN